MGDRKEKPDSQDKGLFYNSAVHAAGAAYYPQHHVSYPPPAYPPPQGYEYPPYGYPPPCGHPPAGYSGYPAPGRYHHAGYPGSSHSGHGIGGLLPGGAAAAAASAYRVHHMPHGGYHHGGYFGHHHGKFKHGKFGKRWKHGMFVKHEGKFFRFKKWK